MYTACGLRTILRYRHSLWLGETRVRGLLRCPHNGAPALSLHTLAADALAAAGDQRPGNGATSREVVERRSGETACRGCGCGSRSVDRASQVTRSSVGG